MAKLERLIPSALVFILTTCLGKNSNLERRIVTLCHNQEIIQREENTDFKKMVVKYNYKNGIQADVLYEKTDSEKAITITIREDAQNLLTRNTPRETPMNNAVYKIILNKNNDQRTINFSHNRYNVTVFIRQGSFAYAFYEDKETKEI